MLTNIARFGGRRSACQYAFYRCLAAAGGFRKYRDIDWSRVERLVFVCAGNICRSPYGAERARSFGADVVSCGTTGIDGAFADKNAARIAMERGVRLDAHRSTSLTTREFSRNDLVIVMEPVHLQKIVPATALSGAQVTLMGIWCSHRAPSIPDPYGKDDQCFHFIFGLIDDALNGLMPHLRRRSAP